MLNFPSFPSHFGLLSCRCRGENFVGDAVHHLRFFVDGFITKHLTDLLQSLPTGFRNEEKREDAGSDTDTSEEEIGAPAKRDQHLWDYHSNDEIGDPDHGDRKADTFAPLGGAEALGWKGLG